MDHRTPEACPAHDELAHAINAMSIGVTKLSDDLRWVIKLGQWALGVAGASACLLVPVMIYGAQYIVNLDTRLTAVEVAFQMRKEAPAREKISLFKEEKGGRR